MTTELATGDGEPSDKRQDGLGAPKPSTGSDPLPFGQFTVAESPAQSITESSTMVSDVDILWVGDRGMLEI